MATVPLAQRKEFKKKTTSR